MANIDTSEKRRPSPKTFLELARKEKLGRLKVFLGAAPGVGKTFAMLSAAQAQKREGIDVVVGVVETHGRSETAALLDGMEVLPRKALEYRGRSFMEFDIEGAIARRPALILIDEFAHTNAEGSLHAKRYQDVQELLNAGIDVWTTLNIQHLESLTDVVQKITGVTVREVVPDKILENADEVVVIDLPPEDLIQRLKEGKVYLPENARQAADRFFKAANLTALRELALRRTTDRVDEQMLTHLRLNAIEGAWPTAERLLVCVGSGEQAEGIVRVAGRMAAALKSPWVALQLQTANQMSASRTSRRKSEKALRLAERLGAETVRLSSKDMVTEILKYARQNNITQIVIGRSRRKRLGIFSGKTLSEELTSRAAGVAITVVAADQAEDLPGGWRLPDVDFQAKALVTSALAVAAAVLAGTGLGLVTPLPNVAILFLLAVVVCAIRFGVASAVSASIISFLAYNFFFIEPLYTFTVAKPYELVALFVFLIVAIMTASIAGRLHEQAEVISQSAQATEALYDFSRKLSAATNLDDVVWLLAHQASRSAKGTSIVLLQNGSELHIKSAWPPDDALSTSDWAAARWAVKNDAPAGRFTSTMPGARFMFRPLRSSNVVLGALGVEFESDAASADSSSESGLQALADLAAIAVERTMLVEKAANTTAAVENERLRNALLSSLSHDLRTPLSSIVGAVTSLRELGSKMSEADRSDLLAAIQEESERLSRFVSNLLDMTRLEAGPLDIRRDWIDVADAVQCAVFRAQKSFEGFKIETRIAPGLPLIRGDASLLQQVVFNLLDNAQKFAGHCEPALVEAARHDNEIILSVSDNGPGIPAGSRDLVFKKFYRVEQGDGRVAGTGLGLAIAHAVVSTFGGTISAESPVRDGKGTRIVARFPIPVQPGKSDT
jgi:two-component system sensor histidine kinase KdpD